MLVGEGCVSVLWRVKFHQLSHLKDISLSSTEKCSGWGSVYFLSVFVNTLIHYAYTTMYILQLIFKCAALKIIVNFNYLLFHMF